SFEDLRAGAVVGTSSPRRRALARALRPDLVLEPIRGNVDTRVRKLESGPWDALILAAAGLSRLGLTPRYAWPLDPPVFVPAGGRGGGRRARARARGDAWPGRCSPEGRPPGPR